MTFNLNDKYTSSDGKFVLSGIQAIVKLSLLQKEIDERELIGKMKIILGIKEEDEDYELYFQKLSEDIYHLLFKKQLLEKALIYARYHAKAMGD